VNDSERALVEEVARRKAVAANVERIRECLSTVRVIYTDIDGTMVGPLGCFFRDSSYELTLEPARALMGALARNIDVMLVSGRHKSQLREVARLLGCMNYVAELGTELVYNLGMEVVHNTGALDITCDTVYETILATGVVRLLLSTYPGKIEMHTPWSDERDCTPLMRGYLDLTEVEALLKREGFEHFELLDNGVIPRNSPTLEVPETRAYHLVPRGVSKDRAVLKDREIRGFEKSETVCIGDAEADLPFAQVAGVFFMVRNGLENNPHLAGSIDSLENVFVTEGRMGVGWAEAVETVLSF
jgi:phosphoglycolate phosphatase